MGEGLFLYAVAAALAMRGRSNPGQMIAPRFRAHHPSPWEKKCKGREGSYTPAQVDRRAKRKAERMARKKAK